MYDGGRDTQCAYRKSRIGICVIEVVIHEPVDGPVRNNIDLAVVEVRDLRQHNRRTICLYTVFQEAFDILQKFFYGYFFVCVVAAYVYTYNRYKFNLRVGL